MSEEATDNTYLVVNGPHLVESDDGPALGAAAGPVRGRKTSGQRLATNTTSGQAKMVRTEMTGWMLLDQFGGNFQT